MFIKSDFEDAPKLGCDCPDFEPAKKPPKDCVGACDKSDECLFREQEFESAGLDRRGSALLWPGLCSGIKTSTWEAYREGKEKHDKALVKRKAKT